MSTNDGLGARLDATTLSSTLSTLLDRMARPGAAHTPLCIWGTHGIGKTTLIEDLTRAKGWRYAYCAPAQFEEMGDLHGLPVLKRGDDGVERTSFAPPDWVPREAGPGVLLLDDFNRADDRILRGLMQLMQRGGLMSWNLPKDWQIVVTANPETASYSVTTLDEAMVDRMLHFTLRFDPKAWARWAVSAGVDTRGISFVLTCPEAVVGGRTTPRSLCRYFELIAGLQDWKAEREQLQILGMSILEEATVATFLAFVQDNLESLLEPEQVLDAEDAEWLTQAVQKVAGGDGVLRVDRLSTVGTRLVIFLTQKAYRPQPHHADNLVRFLLHPKIPNDLRMGFHRELIADGNDHVKKMLRHPELAKVILAGM